MGYKGYLYTKSYKLRLPFKKISSNYFSKVTTLQILFPESNQLYQQF